MLALPLDMALTILVMCCSLMAVQLVLVSVEIAALKRELQRVKHTLQSLNRAVNPWAGDDDPTQPRIHVPPELARVRKWIWFEGARKPDDKRKRRVPPE